MAFKVSYRGNDGAQESIIIDAASRPQLFAELEKRGISAIRVEETTGKPKKARPSTPSARKPSPLRGLLAGLLVISLAVAAWFYLLPTLEHVKAKKDKKPALIAEVAPEIAEPTPVEEEPQKSVEAIDPGKLPHPAYKQPTNPNLPKKLYIPTVEEVEKARLGPDGKPRTMSIYKSAMEQSLGMIFSTPLGSPPPMLPDIPRCTSQEQLEEFLNRTFEYDKDAPLAVNENRIMMNQVKDELKKYLEDGGDIGSFVEFYVGELQASYDQWKTAQKMLIEMSRAGESAEDLRNFRDAANELLSQSGIRPLQVPPSVRRTMGEE